MNRRDSLKLIAAATSGIFLPAASAQSPTAHAQPKSAGPSSLFNPGSSAFAQLSRLQWQLP